MNQIKITQVKSAIKRPLTQKLTLASLGLRKLNKPKVHNATPTILGMVDKVKHLLKVEEVK
jgi:large subunit ribosomal protein L30